MTQFVPLTVVHRTYDGFLNGVQTQRLINIDTILAVDASAKGDTSWVRTTNDTFEVQESIETVHVRLMLHEANSNP